MITLVRSLPQQLLRYGHKKQSQIRPDGFQKEIKLALVGVDCAVAGSERPALTAGLASFLSSGTYS